MSLYVKKYVQLSKVTLSVGVKIQMRKKIYKKKKKVLLKKTAYILDGMIKVIFPVKEGDLDLFVCVSVCVCV